MNREWVTPKNVSTTNIHAQHNRHGSEDLYQLGQSASSPML